MKIFKHKKTVNDKGFISGKEKKTNLWIKLSDCTKILAAKLKGKIMKIYQISKVLKL